MNAKVIAVYVPVELAEKVDQMAIRLCCSRGFFVKQLLADWLGQEKGRKCLLIFCAIGLIKGRGLSEPLKLAESDPDILHIMTMIKWF